MNINYIKTRLEDLPERYLGLKMSIQSSLEREGGGCPYLGMYVLGAKHAMICDPTGQEILGDIYYKGICEGRGNA